MKVPEIRYAKSGDVNIAYQVVGEGALDLVYVPTYINHIEHLWEEPSVARFFERLTSFSRLILFDRRGSGLSDPLPTAATLEEQVDDVLAVMDAAESQEAAIMASLQGGAMAALFAATHPERTAALVLYAALARSTYAPDYSWAPTPEERGALKQALTGGWGDGRRAAMFAPSLSDDERFRAWFARLERLSASPGTVERFHELMESTDVREVLPSIRVPTLVLHRRGDQVIDIRHSRYIAEHIPEARLVELPGEDTLPTVGDPDSLLDEVEEFLTGARHEWEPDRQLATVLFTDVVKSTEQAVRLGDQRWRDLLASHDTVVRRQLERFEGREVKTLGDGFLATFDGPARGVRCACAIRDALTDLGLESRSGLHTGECEVIDDDLGGLAVHIAARVMATADPGEVLVSRTITDLVAGSGIRFEPRGSHHLKGVPGEWQLFAVEGQR